MAFTLDDDDDDEDDVDDEDNDDRGCRSLAGNDELTRVWLVAGTPAVTAAGYCRLR